MQEFELTPERKKELKAIKRDNVVQRSAYVLGSPFQAAVLAVVMPYNMVKAGIQAKKDNKKIQLLQK